jgi:hypothetical protein
MKTKILVALILLIILVIVIIWKRWMCMQCGCDTKKYEFKVEPRKCTRECLVPEYNPAICHTKARYWLSGGDADVRAISDLDARSLMNLILNFGTWDTLGDGSHKFLWIESKSTPTWGHSTAATALPLLGLTLGVDYDWVNGSEFDTVDLNQYTAICVASTMAGMLTSLELTKLHARKNDIRDFAIQGGSIVMFAGLEPNSYTWLPFSVITSNLSIASGFTATAFGSNVGLTSPTMEYPHRLIFLGYPTDRLIPAEKHSSRNTTLISKHTNITNTCLDKKVDIPNTSGLCPYEPPPRPYTDDC